MRRFIYCVIILAVIIMSNPGYSYADQNDVSVFYGCSDASGAVFLTDNLIVIGDDESNILRVYDINKPGMPLQEYDLNPFLKPDPDSPEVDLEDATRIDNTIYWITSHGRNKNGKYRESRYRFFALAFSISDGKVIFKTVGSPYRKLAHHLVASDKVKGLGLDEATRFDDTTLSKKELKKLAPKKDGLNIECLAASSDNKELFIGLRNPRPKHPVTGKKSALVIPLLNGPAVIDGKHTPQFGNAILWDFNGLGIRSMTYSKRHNRYFIIAGAENGDDEFGLYQWDGKSNSIPKLILTDFGGQDFNPEIVLAQDNSNDLVIISDDGSRLVNVESANDCLPGTFLENSLCENKHLANPASKTFRAFRYTPLP